MPVLPGPGESGGSIIPDPNLGLPSATNTSQANLRNYVAYDQVQGVFGRPDTPDQDELPGDLGQLFVSSNTLQLTKKSLRSNASTNVASTTRNHRFSGHREHWKFNLAMQTLLATCATMFYILDERNTTARDLEQVLGPAESDSPTLSETALFCHIREQIAFKEWLIMRDADVKWFQ
jgi:hypothetical protein